MIAKWSAAAVTAVLAAVAVWWVMRAPDAACAACLRPVHSHSRTTGLLDGKPAAFCCPMCALTELKQSGRKVTVTALSDYNTGAALDPSTAVVVRNSDANPCMDDKGHVTADKQPMHVHFDRCAPSLLAFGTRDAAVEFQRRHGGTLTRLDAVAP